MFKDREEAAFYALSGAALALVLWASGLFGLRSYPFAVILLLSAFAISLALGLIGQRMIGREDESIQVLLACGALAFFVVLVSNPGKGPLGSLATPTALMFLAPGALYYVRKFSKKNEPKNEKTNEPKKTSEPDVRSK